MMVGFFNKYTLCNKPRLSVSDIRLVELFLLLSVVFCLLSQVVSLLGGSFSPISEWTLTYFSYSTSFGQYVTLLKYSSQLCLIVVLLSVIVKNGASDPILIILSLTGFVLYLVVEIAGGANPLEVVFGSIPLSVFLVPLFVFVGQDVRLASMIAKWSIPLAFVCFFASGLITLWFRLSWGWTMEFGDFPGRAFYGYAICAMWVACFARSAKNNSQRKLMLLLCALGLLFGLFLNVRSWVLQCAVAFLFVYVLQARGKAVATRSIKAMVLLVTFVAVLALAFPSAFDTFGARLGDDTRSGQYDVFFDQVDPASLILGLGSEASYSYGSYASYKYFDNQLIFVAFHYGAIPVICFLYVILRSLLGVRNSGFKPGLRFIAAAWLAAVVGLSTYFSYEMNYFIVSLVVIAATGLWSPSLSDDDFGNAAVERGC